MSEPKNTTSDEAMESTTGERRGNPRRTTFAVFTMRFPETSVMGAGRNVSPSGAYFISSDEVPVEVCYERNGQEKRLEAKLVRVDRISAGTMGVAVQFERPLSEDDLP